MASRETRDELGEYAGWLLKGAPKIEDDDKETSVVRKLKRAANALLGALAKHGDFKRRFFVLDGNELRYYRDDSMTHQSGTIDLGTVLDVKYADDSRVPAFAIQLVTDARTFTVAPSPASQEAGAEWFTRLSHKIEGSRRRGLLSRSLKSARRMSFGAQAGGGKSKEQEKKEKKRKDNLASLVLPLYLSHEACRMSPEALLQGAVNLSALGGGAAAGSGLRVLLEGNEGMLPTGTASGVETGTVAVLNMLAMRAAAKAEEKEASAVAEAGRRGSRIFAAPDFSASVTESIDMARRDRPAAVVNRRASIKMTAGSSALQLSLGKSSLADRLAAVAGDMPRPTTLGFGKAGSVGGSKGAEHKRSTRRVTRWEEMTGNVPRWSLSVTNDHRLKHIPLFAPVLGLGPGQTGWLAEEAVGKGNAEDYVVLGKVGSKAKKAKDKEKKKKAKSKAKKADAKAKLKAKAKKALKGVVGTDDDDDDDDEEDDDDDEDGSGEDVDDADDEARAAVGVARLRASVGLGQASGRGLIGRQSKSAAHMAQAALKAASRELRTRVDLMHVCSTSGGAEELGEDPQFVEQEWKEGPRVSGDAPRIGTGHKAQPPSYSARFGPLPPGHLPGARGFETNLLLALSSKERAFLAYAKSQLSEHARLGWDLRVGVADVPLLDLVLMEAPLSLSMAHTPHAHASVYGVLAHTGVGTGAVAELSGGEGRMEAGPPSLPARLLSDTSAIADFAAATARHTALLAGTTASASSAAASRLSYRSTASNSDPGSTGNSVAASRRVSDALPSTGQVESRAGVARTASSIPTLAEVNRLSRAETRSLRAARIAWLKMKGAGQPAVPGDDEGPNKALSGEHCRLVRAVLDRGSTPVTEALAQAMSRAEEEAGKDSDPLAAHTVSARWPVGGKTLAVVDMEGVVSRLAGEEGLPSCLPAGHAVAEFLVKGKEDAPSPGSGKNTAPSLQRMRQSSALWAGGFGAEAGTPSAPSSASAQGVCDRATRITALRLAASAGPDSRAARAGREGEAGRGDDTGPGWVGYGKGFDMWAVSTARDDPACHGGMYGLGGSRALNGWEDPMRSAGLPRSLLLDDRLHTAMFGPSAPHTLGRVLQLDPYGDPDSCAGDAFESSLSFLSMHTVPPGTRLHRAELPYGVPTGSGPLLGDVRSAYVLLHGAVRVTVTPPGGDGAYLVFNARRAWRALRTFIRVQAAFKFAGLSALLAEASEQAQAQGVSVGNGSPVKGRGKGKGAKGGSESDPSTLPPSCMAMPSSPTCGSGGVHDTGLWVELTACAGPVVLGAAALARGAAHVASVVTSTTCTVLELRPSVWPRLCRAFPAGASGLALLGSMGLHDPAALIGCVPSLVAAFAETGAGSLAGADRWPLLTCLAALFRPVTLGVGEPLFVEGDAGDAVYVVVSGSVALSSRCANTGGDTLLAVYGRGGCIGDSALACPGPRACKAVALTSTLCLRLTSASTASVLAGRPRVRREVRNAAVWRVPAQLIRLPLLSYLAGGESRQALLAPLADLFRPIVLHPGPPRPHVPGAFLSRQGMEGGEQPASPCAWDVKRFTSSHLIQEALEGEGVGVGGVDLRCLLLVAHGAVEVSPTPGTVDGAPLLYGPADWIGGSTLFTGRHAAEVARMVPTTHTEGGEGNASPRSPMSHPQQHCTCAVLFGVPRHALDAFVSTLPEGSKRLKLWRDTGGNTAILQRLDGTLSGAEESEGEAASESADGEWGRKGKGKGKGLTGDNAGLRLADARGPALSALTAGPINPLVVRR